MKHTLLAFMFFLSGSLHSQSWRDFKAYYPIHIKPSIGYLSSMNDTESIVFDAKPVVYYSFWNNIRQRITDTLQKPGNTIYATFQPHIRMYDETSLPVKTPSYRVGLGWQHLRERDNRDFWIIGIETGHYSNGQSGCSFNRDFDDETPDCDAFLRTITSTSNLSALLNRDNGNFSTNWTKLSFNYRINTFRKDDRPRITHSLNASYELYHNNLLGVFDIGGFSRFDIGIYGKHRFHLGYELIHNYSSKLRYSLEAKATYIATPHEFINPFRGELSFIWYPGNLDFGVFTTLVTGHDNYNYRFVDSGNQIGFGVIWDWFAPVNRAHSKLLDELEYIDDL
jgi:hypothetical protein